MLNEPELALLRRLAIVCGIALGAVFCVLVVIAVALLIVRGPAEVLEIGEDLNLASDEARLEVPAPGGGAMTLEGARNKAVFALESHESYCPHILGGTLDIAFGSGISIQHDGSWYLRARCTDNAYLVVVSDDDVEIKTCAAARDAGQSCQKSGWLTDYQP